MLETEQWAECGIRSPEHWLIVRAGLSPARARDIVTLARRATELAEVVELLGAGRLGVDQASVVARYTPPEYAASVAELAVHATVPQLRRLLSRYQFAETDDHPSSEAASADSGELGSANAELDADSGKLDGPAGERSPDSGTPVGGCVGADVDERRPQLSMSTVDGQFRLSFTAPASLGALVEQAIREAKDALFATGASDAVLADGLVEVARRSLSTLAGTSRTALWRIYVHLDTHGAFLGHTGRLPRHCADRLTCDGVLQPVWETDAVPVSVGRASRIVPARTRRLVLARDQGCRFPGCQVSGGHVEVHHLVPWRNGGATDMDNLVTLCDFHHDRHHEGAFSMTGSPSRPGQLQFWDPHGNPIGPLTAAIRLANPGDDIGPVVYPGPWAWDRPSAGSDLLAFDAGRRARDEARESGDPDTPDPDTPDPDTPDDGELSDSIAWFGPTGERLHTEWVTFTALADQQDRPRDDEEIEGAGR